MLLSRYSNGPLQSLPDAEVCVDKSAKGSTFELKNSKERFVAEFNATRIGEITLISSGCDVANRVTWAPADFIRHIFQTSSFSTFSYDKHAIVNDPTGGGCAVPPGTVLKMDNAPNAQILSFRITPHALQRKLSALVGENAEVPDFEYSGSYPMAAMRSLRRAAFDLALEIDQIGSRLSAPVLAELGQSLILQFLLCHRHSYSGRLMRIDAPPSQRQLKLIEDYIAEHWSTPLDIERLAEVSNISSRTIFRLFAKERGYSPASLIKKIRLEHARAMLLRGGQNASVIAIALKCGFQSFGHFAREYRVTFGELPFSTLKKNKPTLLSESQTAGEVASTNIAN